MARLVHHLWQFEVTKQQLIDLEYAIVRALDWDLHYVSPLLFLDRFLHLLHLDTADNQEGKEGGYY